MKCRILIVEDSATQAEALRVLLEEDGYEIVLARSAEAALERIAESGFDLVLSDVVMPGLSGIELCTRIRQDPFRRDLPVVLLTSLTDPMDIVRGLECGADNYITKPYDPEHLLARLRNVLDTRRLRRDARTRMGVRVRFLGKDFTITSEKEQILDLFISSVEDVVRANEALQRSQRELAEAHAQLEAYAREKDREARISGERYRALLQNAGDALLVLDAEARILEANHRAEELFGLSTEDLLHRSLDGFVAADSQQNLHEALARLPAERHVHLGELWFVDGGGHKVWCELTASLTPLGEEDLVLVIAQDVTERKNAERALREREAAERANRAKSEFLSRMSHELRTPLNAILGFAQLLEMDELEAEQLESVEQILRGGRHLLDLINEVLDLSRIEAGRLALSLEPVPLGDLLRDVGGLVQPLAAQRGIKLVTELADAEPGLVCADLQRLKQVLLNFISNAVKYNDEGGRVTVLVRESGADRVRIAVRDTGPGIPPDQLDKLFVPFERLGADESGIQGTGLGLVLAKKLAEAMGGEIGVESTMGEGSTFWVELLRAEGLERVPETPSSGRSRARRHPVVEVARTVLYIEDNPSNLRLIERVLARPGIRLLTAMQGSLGVELAREHRPDLILLDLNLPDISGEEALRRLRAEPALQKTPVVVISADAMPGQADRLREAGALEYLTKPLDIKRFREVVEATLQLEVPVSDA